MADWKKFFLKYFDANGNKEVDWWEYLFQLDSCWLSSSRLSSQRHTFITIGSNE